MPNSHLLNAVPWALLLNNSYLTCHCFSIICVLSYTQFFFHHLMWRSVHRHFCILTEDVEDIWIIFGFLLPNWSSCNTGVEKGWGQNCLVPQEKLILYWKLRPRTDLLPQDHLYVLGKEDFFKGTEFILCRKGREEEQKTALHHGYDVSLILEVGKSKGGKVVSHQSYWNA